MKNRFCILLISLILLLIFALGGCKKDEQSSLSPAVSDSQAPTSTDNQSSLTPDGQSPASQDESPMSKYKAVLQNKARFFCVDADKELYISQINQVVSDDSSVKAEVTKFAIVDLEKDSIPEIVLWITVNDNTDFGYEVLSCKDGVVYGYTLWYRSFMNLKEDGTFSFSGGASDYGFGRVAFTDKGCTIDNISYCESVYDSENNLTVSYFVNHEKASEEDFQSAMDKQDEKPDVTWYDFIDDNISGLSL